MDVKVIVAAVLTLTFIFISMKEDAGFVSKRWKKSRHPVDKATTIGGGCMFMGLYLFLALFLYAIAKTNHWLP